MNPIGTRTLWSGTVGLFSAVDPRIVAARDHGYHQLSIGPADVEQAAAEGRSARELGKRIRGAGLEIVIDPIMNWYDDVSATSTSPFSRYSTDDALRCAEELGAVALSAMANIGVLGDRSIPELAEPFADVSRRAGDLGARVQLEFIPMTHVATLAEAWRIVRDAAAVNGGLVFDTWHFFRGTPDFATLAAVPGDRIFAVQVSDALAELRGTLLEDTRERRLPGDGSFDLVRVIRELDAIGALACVGPEVISSELEAKGASEAARIAAASMDDLLAAALGPPRGITRE